MDQGCPKVQESALDEILQKTTLLSLYDDDVRERRGKQLALTCDLKYHTRTIHESRKGFNLCDARCFIKDVHDYLKKRSGDDLRDVEELNFSCYNLAYCEKIVHLLKASSSKAVRNTEDQTTFVTDLPLPLTAASQQLLFWQTVSWLLEIDLRGIRREPLKEPSDPSRSVGEEHTLRDTSIDEFQIVLADSLDAQRESVTKSIAAINLQLQHLEQSTMNVRRKIAFLRTENNALLNRNSEHAECIMTASEDIQTAQEKIMETIDAETDMVPRIWDELVSANCLPTWSVKKEQLLNASTRNEYTPRTLHSQVLSNHGIKTLSEKLETIRNDFMAQYSAATAELEPEGNDAVQEELTLRRMMATWVRQPAQWCLDKYTVQGRTLKEWMPMSDEDTDLDPV